MRLSALMIPLALAVSGCGKTGGMEIDSARFVCKDEPAVPDEPVTDEKNGAYLRGMRGAWADCRSKLYWVRDFVRPK